VVGPPDLPLLHSKYDFETRDKAMILALKRGQVVKVLPDARFSVFWSRARLPPALSGAMSRKEPKTKARCQDSI